MIKQILKKLFCLHKWEQIFKLKKTIENRDWMGNNESDEYYVLIYKCTECGKIKKITI